MVSVVFVELVGDAGEAPSVTTFVFEDVECVSWSDIAAGVCEEAVFRMEIKVWHASIT